MQIQATDFLFIIELVVAVVLEDRNRLNLVGLMGILTRLFVDAETPQCLVLRSNQSIVYSTIVNQQLPASTL